MEEAVEKYTDRLMSEDDDGLDKILPGNYSDLEEEAGETSDTHEQSAEEEGEEGEENEDNLELRGAVGGVKRRHNKEETNNKERENLHESPELKQLKLDEAGEVFQEVESEKEKGNLIDSNEAMVKILERRSNQGDFSDQETPIEGTSLEWRPEDLHIVEENERENQIF